MQPSTHAADATDRFDPWGFGTTAADEPTILVATAGLDAPIAAPVDTGAHGAVQKLLARVAESPRMTAWPRAPWPPAAPAAQPIASAPTTTPAEKPAPKAPRISPALSSPSIPSSPVALPPASLAGRLFSKDMVGVLALCALVILGQALYIGLSLTGEVRASAAPTGDVVVSSHPAGARVAIDGRDQGVTPVVVSLPVGRHRVDVTSTSGAPQTLEADVTEGARWTRHLELTPASATTAVITGGLRIDTAVAGAAVWIDGASAGRTPLTVPTLGAGPHTVRVQFASGSIVERRVALGAGETVSLVLDAPAAKAVTPTGPASGWVRVQTPFDVQVLEAGQVVGSSASERIMVTAGPHVFELVNAALGFRATVKVVVGAGRTEPLIVDSPRALVQVNAQPWAEVVVDGRVAGDTPLANLQLAIGVHQFVFRHPEFGERSQTVTVRLDTPNRVTADLRR